MWKKSENQKKKLLEVLVLNPSYDRGWKTFKSAASCWLDPKIKLIHAGSCSPTRALSRGTNKLHQHAAESLKHSTYSSIQNNKQKQVLLGPWTKLGQTER
jgi:hypothetical protein